MTEAEPKTAKFEDLFYMVELYFMSKKVSNIYLTIVYTCSFPGSSIRLPTDGSAIFHLRHNRNAGKSTLLLNIINF